MKKIAFIFALFVFSSIASADVLFQDPEGFELDKKYRSMESSDIIRDEGAEDKELEYISALLYLKGDERLRVEKDCKAAVSLLNDVWNNGGADAGYTLSTMYYKGECVDKDSGEAKRLLVESAKKGYLLAQRELGRSYWGRGQLNAFPKNMEKAIFWLKRAGESGDGVSSANLSYIYLKGLGVKKDAEKSFAWRKRAAFSSDSYGGGIGGFLPLAEYYEKGIGTNLDLVQAYKYYDLSGSAGVKDKQRIAKEMTQEQIDEALRQSKEWQKEHNVKIGGGSIRQAN
ncbi:tetratricopeptide repeat protein [Salinicola lusitanus]|uniref:Tetratricopeptide repeat protein n=1 Tax=Salinicola lusitanus TaxID=1949085 RepID=A0ABZ3CRT8_9GAMM